MSEKWMNGLGMTIDFDGDEKMDWKQQWEWMREDRDRWMVTAQTLRAEKKIYVSYIRKLEELCEDNIVIASAGYELREAQRNFRDKKKKLREGR